MIDNDKVPPGWSAGELIGVCQPGVVVELDCSGGETDIPDDQWCDGELIGVCQPGMVVELDCSHWEQEPVEPVANPRPPENPRPAPAAEPAG